MTDEPKCRCDAWESTLSEEQQWEIYEKARGRNWIEVSKFLQEEYGITVRRTAIFRWLKRMRSQESTHRLECAIAARQELKDLADTGALDAATADAYMALANDAILAGNPDKAAKIVSAAVAINAASLKLAAQRQQSERLELQKQELELKREKFEAQERRLAEISGTAGDETLTEAERLTKIRSIFGLK